MKMRDPSTTLDERDPDDAAEASSLVLKTVTELRRMVLDAAKPGTFLGSEKDLLERLGVSRPTFRQATKLLMYENLLKIRRGVGVGSSRSRRAARP